MTRGLLLDTHIVIRWLVDVKKLSHNQSQVLRDSIRRHEPFALSAISLLEIAVLFDRDKTRSKIPINALLTELGTNPDFKVVPFTVDVAAEVAAIGKSLHDPADRAIVSTARVLGCRLVTSDQRIIQSGLVPVIE